MKPIETRQIPLSSAVESTNEGSSAIFQPSASSLAKLSYLTESIKRPRGVSIGVQYAPSTGVGDVAILSMQLRKMNAQAIYTYDIDAAKKFAKEQDGARGEFPGPVPVVYYSTNNVDGWREAVDVGVDAVVLDYDMLTSQDSNLLENVGAIWEVADFDDIKKIMDKECGNVFMLSEELLTNEEGNEINMDILEKHLSSVPESAILIAPIPSMLPENHEIALAKSLAATGSISSILIRDCCVNDEEDIKYAQFAIDGMNKKSSSSFSMIGLTGSTNGHFGVSSHEGEVKWRRKSV